MGGKSVCRAPISSLTSVSRSVRSDASRRRALPLSSRAASASGGDRARGVLGGERLQLEARDLVRELLARLGDLRQLFRVGRASGDLARLCAELGELPAELGDACLAAR